MYLAISGVPSSTASPLSSPTHTPPALPVASAPQRWWRLVEQKALNVEWPLQEIRRAAKNGMDQKSLKEESRLTTGTIEIMCNNPYGNSIWLEVIKFIHSLSFLSFDDRNRPRK
jgi:hypothetical protein